MTDHRALDPPAPVDPVRAPTRSVFAELVCADPGLLRVEFDALIAANFPPADDRRSRCPPRRPGRTGTDRFRSVPPSGPRGTDALTVRTRPLPGPDRPARERSPPRSGPNPIESPNDPRPRPHEGGEGIDR